MNKPIDYQNPPVASTASGKMRLGEFMVDQGLITRNQLGEALKRQSQVGEHIGSILLELGHVTIEELLGILRSQFGVPAINLFDQEVEPQVTGLIPSDQIREKQVLPIAIQGNRLILAMVNPKDLTTVSELEFRLGKKIDPVVVPSFMMDTACEMMTNGSMKRLSGKELEQQCNYGREGDKTGTRLVALLKKAVGVKASDLILTAGAPPSLRIVNNLKRLAAPPLTPADCEAYAREMMPDKTWHTYLDHNDVDFSVTFPEIGRFRVNAYRQRNSAALAVRPVIEAIPSASELNIPPWLMDYALKPSGLIVVSGPAGHGKSTTLYAMVDMINNHKRSNIISLEDPVEFLHKHKKSNISQREVGVDTPSFYSGLKSVLRQAPDVIVVGEMRDKESFEIALQASYTGHLVITTMHAGNATVAIENTIQMFEPHKQTLIRMMLADAMIVSVAQRLVPLKDRSSRVLAVERLVNSYRVKNLIREGKTHQIRSQMQQGTEDFASIDIELAGLHKDGRITMEDGMILANDKHHYRELTESARPARDTRS
ncbi:MAG: PilT/PilU family type 4a pilus ATPase [Desulfobacterales bacterium]|nr:PilT/PilU family type 4a pilus ATPase [Desulfobacterales bacterium]MBS3754723.1 PilT/PilU family type 4a pilus ATPase [Desulfobacterales bacterium]